MAESEEEPVEKFEIKYKLRFGDMPKNMELQAVRSTFYLVCDKAFKKFKQDKEISVAIKEDIDKNKDFPTRIF